MVAFQKVDKDRSGTISREEFSELCQSLHLDLEDFEKHRFFSEIDIDNSGQIDNQEFLHGLNKHCLFGRMVRALHCEYEMPDSYDFSVPTCEALKHPAFKPGRSTYSEAHHGPIRPGRCASIRENLIDYGYHANYTEDRQQWQDGVVHLMTKSTQKIALPWILFSCGPMGAGKGFAIRYLSRVGVLPLEKLVHIDPDHYKQMMPEWEGYKSRDAGQAGTMCHKESGFLQELATEVALMNRQNVWVDGSLQDYEWYTRVFQDIRRRYPMYRIALLYVYASTPVVLERAEKRGQQTGRYVPRDTLLKSIQCTTKSVEVLSPLTDWVAHIDNNGTTPVVQIIEDRSRSLARVRDAFKLANADGGCFPYSLEPIRFSKHVTTQYRFELPEKLTEQLRSGVFDMADHHVYFIDETNQRGPAQALSTISEMNWDHRTQQVLDVPACCKWFAYAQGHRITESTETSLYSCFVFFSSDGQICGATSMRRKGHDHTGTLSFGDAAAIPSDFVEKLNEQKRWMSPARPLYTRQHADAMTWIAPHELPVGPFGGFGYKLKRTGHVFFPIAASE
eukprot:TRINITY_DN4969_c0_g1_i3.p1 TRINITY_DN4969_c0_g1~~TRINITY_DN4969_c0_g1_i3.p1  ORF type:complete len:639 (+),score=56.05 TRINITY_DN4969_c0_g1_i3:232-1917(+)